MCARRNFVGTHGNFFALASDHSSTLVMNKQSGPHREILPLKPFRAFRAPGFPPNCKRLRGDIPHSFFGNWFAVLLLSANPRLSFFQTSTCPTPCLNLSARAPFRPLTGPSLFREEPRRPRIHHRGCTCGREISPLSSPTASIADAARSTPGAHLPPRRPLPPITDAALPSPPARPFRALRRARHVLRRSPAPRPGTASLCRQCPSLYGLVAGPGMAHAASANHTTVRYRRRRPTGRRQTQRTGPRSPCVTETGARSLCPGDGCRADSCVAVRP